MEAKVRAKVATGACAINHKLLKMLANSQRSWSMLKKS